MSYFLDFFAANEIELANIDPASDKGLEFMDELRFYSVHGVYHLEFEELAGCLQSKLISRVVKTSCPDLDKFLSQEFQDESQGLTCISQLSPEFLSALRCLPSEKWNALVRRWSSMAQTETLGIPLEDLAAILEKLIELATFAHSHQRHVYLCEVT